MDNPDPTDAEPPVGYCLRFTFAYRGDEVELVDRARVRMVAPLSDPYTGNASFRVQLRDGDENPLFDRRLIDPVRREREVFSANPDEQPFHVPVDNPHGAFEIVVPDLPDAEHLVLERATPRTAADTAGRDRARSEIVRIRLSREEESR